MIREIAPAELAVWRADGNREPPVVVDVREPWELACCALPDVVHVPMREVPGRVGELPRERDVVVVCHHGVRSLQVARYPAGIFGPSSCATRCAWGWWRKNRS